MTVAQNIEYGLRVRHVPKAERREKTGRALEMVRLPGLGGRKPAQLSGGQRQRVALARAIVNEPEVLLLDEPLGALDLKLRQEMQLELQRVQRQVGITFVYVTHDQEEALTMSDRIAVLSQGRIEQIGGPAEVYERPRTAFVAGFIGVSNLIERDGHTITVRPEKITLLEDGQPDPPGTHVESGQIQDVIYAGVLTRYVVTWTAAANWWSARQNTEAPGPAHRQHPGAHRLAAGTGIHDPAGPKLRGGLINDQNQRADPPDEDSARTRGRVRHRGRLLQRRQHEQQQRQYRDRHPERRHSERRGRGCGPDGAHRGPAGAAEDRQGRGPAQPHRLGGLPAAAVGQAVRAADRMPGEREVRGQFGRDGRADEERRRRPVRHGVLLGRRRPAHPVRGRRAPGEHQPDPELEGLLPRLPVAGLQHHQRRALRGLAAVGPERADVQHQGLPDRPDVVERHLQPEVQGTGDRPRQPDPDRRRGALPQDPQAGAGASPTRTS